MGLAEEVSAMQATKGAAAPTPTKQYEGTEMFNTGIAKEESAPAAAPEKPAEKASTKIRIGDKEFASPEEAIAYAQDLDRKQATSEAYLKGITEAAPKVESPKIRSLEEEISDQLFENPAEALSKYKKAIMDEVIKQQKKEAAEVAAVKSTWDKFYNDYPDLSGMGDLVEWVAEKNKTEIGELPLDKGLKELAERTRAVIKKISKDSRKETELPNVKAVVTTPGGTDLPVSTTKEVQTVDFIAQVNKLRKRGAKNI